MRLGHHSGPRTFFIRSDMAVRRGVLPLRKAERG